MKRLLTSIIVAALALALAACAAPGADTGAEGVSVVTTVFAPYDFARQLVGDCGSVTMLLPFASASATVI